MSFRVGNEVRRGHGSWYRGTDCNFHPQAVDFIKPGAIDEFVCKGWSPSKPLVTREQYITAFGSCFAARFTQYLIEKGYRVFGGDLRLDSHIIRFGDGMVSTAVIAQQFRWAYGELSFEEKLWFASSEAPASDSDEIKENTRKILDQTDVFILTFGLSEVWIEKSSGNVFWRGVPAGVFDPERHDFKLLDVQENKKNLQHIHRLIRARHPFAPIILTLSPIPLLATFRPVSCITANEVSKAILRVALDEFMREHEADTALFYFPSYEIVNRFVRDNVFKEDLRHLRPEVLRLVQETFHRQYLI